MLSWKKIQKSDGIEMNIKIIKRFDEYYNKLEQKIADKEQQIVELTKLLEVLN